MQLARVRTSVRYSVRISNQCSDHCSVTFYSFVYSLLLDLGRGPNGHTLNLLRYNFNL
jgi:hypothetical protein